MGLILGTIFGIYFPVSKDSVKINYSSSGKEYSRKIENINSFEFITKLSKTDSTNSKVFKVNEANQIINYSNKVLADVETKLIQVNIKTGSNQLLNIKNPTKISRIESLATYFKPLGTIFIKLLLLLAIPLVLTTLIVGSASLHDIKTVGKLGFKTLTLYLITTAIALIIGIGLANIIQPGSKISEVDKAGIVSKSELMEFDADKNINFSITEFITESVPRNIFEALSKAEMLQIVFFALLFGIALILVDKSKSKVIIDFLDSASEVLIKMVDIIMKFAPIGVFALIANTISEFGIGIISTLFWYMFTVILGLLIHTLLVYSGFLKLFSKYPIFRFFKKVRNAQTIAFSTSSSAATLPITMETAERDLGIPRKISSFVLPLGATVNMDGTALLQGVAAIFIAQFYGIDLNLMQQITIVFMGILASIGTAPVPGVGMVMLIGILQSVGLPIEGIGIIIGVDRILDMSRTITNITGDLVVAVIVSKVSGENT
jgi:Na+/H+-dicarboxylate symporter